MVPLRRVEYNKRRFRKTMNRPMSAILFERIRNAAVLVGALEAITFAVDKDGTLALRPLVHIRPDSSNEAVRTRAVHAFRRLMSESAQAARDEAIPYMVTGDAGVSRYCLALVMSSEKSEHPPLAMGFIVRCASGLVAAEKLELLRNSL